MRIVQITLGIIAAALLLFVALGGLAYDKEYFIETSIPTYIQRHEVRLDRRLGIDRCILRTTDRQEAERVYNEMQEGK